MPPKGHLLGVRIQHDLSGGQGHCWRTVDVSDIPADTLEEIEGAIIDGECERCDGWIASNGQHYRWRPETPLIRGE